ncbi:mutS protein homolog 5-like [Halichondria panicea]|uniref:mutS protein homolog 5-like n=1 Tax=Halichondria panicea TaxID=6063 RepID=UPI00312BB1E3
MDTSASGEGSSSHPSIEMTSADIVHQRTRDVGDDYLEISETPQIVLCAAYTGGWIGLSYYTVETGQLHLMNDQKEADDFALFKRVLIQVEPSVIVLSSKADKAMVSVSKDYAESGEEDNTPAQTCSVEVVPSADFKYDQCKRRLLFLDLPGVDKEASEHQKLLQISGLIDLRAELMVRSAGVLLKFVEKRRLGIELEECTARVPLLAVKNFSLDSLMLMDEASFCGLQVFRKEAHPSVYKAGGGGAKEGLSLFGIANKTKSSLGYKMLKMWFLRPLNDKQTLTNRLDAISFLSSPRNEEVATTLHSCIKQIKNIPRILVRMSNAVATISDWKALYKTVYNGIFIGDLCRSLPSNISVFKRTSECLCESIQRVAALIDKVIDFDESDVNSRFCVKSNIDSELDSKRELLYGLPDLLTRAAEAELESFPPESGISHCSIVYVAQLGYLLSLPPAEADKVKDSVEALGLQFVFSNDQGIHYKTDRTKELESQLGDTMYEALDRESEIIHRLQEVVLEQSSELVAVMDVAAELDCLLSLSVFAKEHNLLRPELTSDNVIYIKGGRHPLQELCTSPFVPNDSSFDMNQGRVKLLTGPNASGKSVYLKQVGLIVFMAHIGSFVPAEYAKIGLLDGLFTRVRTRESVSLALSTFMIDMNQVSMALKLSTEKSLVILDEFGKGTATVDGLSLLVSSLRQWLSREDHCPNIIVSTHFHSIIQQKLLPDSTLIEYLTMDTLHDNDDLVFLYKLIRGVTCSSYACKVAAAMGIERSIIDRGSEVTELISQNKPVTRRDSPAMEHAHTQCSALVAKFLQLNLATDDMQAFLKAVLALADRQTVATHHNS